MRLDTHVSVMFQVLMQGTFLIGVELDGGIVRAGAQGGVQITGTLDIADPPDGFDRLNKPELQSGRVYFCKLLPRVYNCVNGRSM